MLNLSTNDAQKEPLERGNYVRLWTSERVPLAFPLAGLGERGFAYVFDFTLWLLIALACAFIYNFWGDLEQDLGALSFAGAFLLLLMFATLALLYDVLFETLGKGQTPGKRFMKVRVIRRDGAPIDLFGALLRNMFRLLDLLPAGYGVGICVLFWTKTQRLGDLVADTVVVSERGRQTDPLGFLSPQSARQPPGDPSRDPLESHTHWSPQKEILCLRLLHRTKDIPEQYASKLIVRVLQEQGHLSSAYAGQDINGHDVEHALFDISAKPFTVTHVLACLRQSVDELENALHAFEHLKKQIKRNPNHHEIDQTHALEKVNHLDRAIRKTSSYLMQATQRGVPQIYIERASLFLFDAQRLRNVSDPMASRMKHFWGTQVPTAIFMERQNILSAAGVLLLASLSGFFLAYFDADIGRALIGDTLAIQIERGAVWTDAIEEQGLFGQAAMQIILNNVRVGILAFLFGLLGGIGTLLVVVTNGLHLGSIFGYAHSLDSASRLAHFVLAHGPVELTAICIAAAAGLCLGRAMVNPGHRTRLNALREEGAQGFRLVMGASVAFILIGGIEGFLSPGQFFPWQLNAVVGIAAWLLLFSWVQLRAQPQGAASGFSKSTKV